MEIIKELALISGLCFLGEFISTVLPFPLPGSIISMVILLLLLVLKIIKLKSIEKVGGWLVLNMAFFFVPPAVSLLAELSLFVENIVPILLICLISTILTFAATAYTVKIVVAIQNKMQRNKR